MQVQTNTQANNANLANSKLSTPVAPVSTPVTPASTPVSSQPTLTPPSALNQSPSPLNQQPTLNQQPQVAAASFSEQNAKVKLNKSKNRVSKKQIPTVLGLLILFVALISGVLLFGQGTGVFAPRATPQTTPKNIRISNVTDKTFTVSFYTDESTVAFIKYGENEQSLDKQASDDRDQLSGIVKDYRLHHITVRGLDASKNYFYVLGTGSSTFDNDGKPYTIATAAKPSTSSPNSQTVYGNVFNADGSPADGAIIYVYSDEIGTLSNIVKSSGSWGISLANAFNLDKSAFAMLTDESEIEIKAQGTDPNLTSSLKTTISAAQPVTDLVLGQNTAATEATSAADITAEAETLNKEELLADVAVATDSAVATESALVSESTESGTLDQEVSSSSGALQDLLASETPVDEAVVDETQNSEVQERVEVNISELYDNTPASATVITTDQPQIKATLPANTVVRVVIHSDTQIDETIQTDADGNLLLDVASLGKNLEPGEHTASYTYIDPVTGEEVTKTVNFTVDPVNDTRQLAAVTNSTPTPTPTTSVPYGSGNPYVPTITVTPTPTVSATGSTTIVATTSGQYSAGSVGMTIALLLGGLFFVVAGVWSYLLSNSSEQKKN